MIATTAAGAPAGAIASPSAPIVAATGGGGAIWPVGWLACSAVPGATVRRRRGRRVRVGAARPRRPWCPTRPRFLSVRTSLGVSTPSTRRPAARSNMRTLVRVAVPKAPSVAAGIAELREIVLQQPHVGALRAHAQAADAEPAPIAGPTALCALEDPEEPLRHARRAIEPGVRAQRPHHRRRVRPELAVGLHRIAEAREHPLQLACTAGPARRGGGPPGPAPAEALPRLRGRNRDADDEQRCEKEKDRLRRTVCEVNGSPWLPGARHLEDAGAGRARWRRVRAAACSVRTDPTGRNRACRGWSETRRTDPASNLPGSVQNAASARSGAGMRGVWRAGEGRLGRDRPAARFGKSRKGRSRSRRPSTPSGAAHSWVGAAAQG